MKNTKIHKTEELVELGRKEQKKKKKKNFVFKFGELIVKNQHEQNAKIYVNLISVWRLDYIVIFDRLFLYMLIFILFFTAGIILYSTDRAYR